MHARDAADPAPALAGVVAVGLGAASALTLSGLGGAPVPTTIALALGVTLSSFHGLRQMGTYFPSSELAPGTAALLESGSVGLVVVAAGLALYALSATIWGIVTGETASMAQLLAQWDAGWYSSIVTEGYDVRPKPSGALEGQANWAFFPLYPLFVRGVVGLTGFEVALAGTVTSVACLTVACGFAHRYLVLTRSRTVALLGVALLALGPYSFYNYTLYTEALFIALTAIGFWALATDRYLTAAFAGGLLSATRAVGVLFGLAMLVHLTRHTDAFDELREAWPKGSLGQASLATVSDRRVLALGLVPTGILAYMGYLWLHIRQPLAFMTVQSAWGRSPGNPFGRLLEAFQPADMFTAYLATAGIIGLALAVDLIARGRAAEGVYGFLLVLVPLISGLNSLPRYAFGTAVLVFAAADRLASTRASRMLGFGVLTAANMLLLSLWYANHHIVN